MFLIDFKKTIPIAFYLYSAILFPFFLSISFFFMPRTIEKKHKMKKNVCEREKNGIYWKDQKDDLDGVTIPTPYLQQFSRFETK